MKFAYTFTFIFILFFQNNFFAQCNFTLSDNNVCGFESINFNVINPSGNYTWDFDGDGNIDATGPNVTYAFPASNNTILYNTLLFRNNNYCQTEQIIVETTPDPVIGVLPGSGVLEDSLIRVCSSLPNVTLDIYNASSTFSSNVNYTIDWGDGTIENFDNNSFPSTNFISHNYSGFGYYNISIEIEGSNGCTNTGEYIFYNGGNPSVGLATPGNTTGLCAPATVDFPITNITNNPTGTIYNVYVSGELITTYTQENVPAVFTYTFLEASCGLTTSTGNYQNAYDVQIEATNPCGSSQATIEPIEVSTPPDVIFSIDQPNYHCEGEEYTFSNENNQGGEVQSGNPSTCTSLPPSWSITPGIPGVDWEITSGNFFGSDEISIIFYTPGNYTITMNLNSPSCGEGVYSQTIEVYGNPISEASVTLATAASPGADECVSTLASFENESTGDSLSFVWSISPSGGWNFEDTSTFTTEDILVNFTEPGDYTVSLLASNFCDSEVWDTVINIAAAPEISFSPMGAFCETATLNFDPSNVNLNANNGTFSSVEWSFPGGIPSSYSGAYPTNIQYDSPGTYVINVTATNQCGQVSASQNFTIQELGEVEMMNDQTVCENGNPFNLTAIPSGGIWSGNGVNSWGLFTPNSNNIGDNILTYTYQDNNCLMQGTMVVSVLELESIDAGPDQETCVDGSVFLITGGTPTNGTWSVNNGGVIIGNNTFDPVASGTGVYTLTYTITDSNNCNNTDTKTIIVHDLPAVEAGLDQAICDNPFDITLTGYSPAGGIWTGTGVSPNGIFNADNTPGLGDYTLLYTFTNPTTNCTNSDSIIISVVPNDVADAGMDEEICINENSFSIQTGTPVGGIWSGNGITNGTNIFDPEAAGVGTHVVTYTFGAGICETSDTKIITVVDLPEITLPNFNEVCLNSGLLDLSGASPSGGTWSGNAISNNQFDPEVAGIGVHTLTYNYTDLNTLCSNSKSIQIEVFDLPTPTANDTSYCNTPGLVDLPQANPAGGTWAGVGVSGNQFDPVSAGGVGNYSLTYTFDDNNNCSNTTTIVASVISPNNVNAGNDFEICIDAEIIDLSQMASPSGGTWNSNGSAGLVGNDFNPMTAGEGIHTLTYTIGTGNCQVSDDLQITIHELPSVETMPDFEVCASENSIILTATPTGGTWTSNNGGVIGANIFNAIASGAGNFSFTYSYSDVNGCINSDDLIITVNPLPIVNSNDTSYCNTPGLVSLPYATPANGIWSGQGVTNNLFDPQVANVNPNGTGNYELVYIFTEPITGCVNFDTIIVTVFEPQTIDAGANDTLCIDQGVHQLAGFLPTNGTWSGNGITDATNGIFDPVVAGVGLHTLIYSFGTGNCYVDNSKTILVVDLSDVDAGPDETTCLIYDEMELSGFSPAGGIWSGVGITNPNVGIFNPEIAQVGNHILTYTFTDALSGCVFSDEKTITVFPMEIPAFNMPELACRNEVISFENLSPSNYAVTWNFGDGDVSTDFSPQHSYDVVGTYEVSLTVQNEHGCVSFVIDSISITDVPVAYFQPDTSEACVGLELNLNNLSVGEELTYHWNFGDNQFSTNEHPEVVYLENGINDTTYIITLTTTNLCGTSTFQDIVTVHPLPTANIGISPQTDCSPLLVDFANITTGAATDFQWDFGNGSTSEELIPPTQTFLAHGNIETYTVTLVSSNICGSDTATTEIMVEPPNVEALAGASQLNGCLPLTVDFYNYSTPGALIDWEFGDGNSSSQTTPTHTFDEVGTYTVIQYANSDCGYDTTTLEITVYPSPEVSFNHPTYVCKNQPMVFQNYSINTSGHFWDFGDGNTSQLNAPEHIFTEAGEYTVTLTGISIYNQCPASYSTIVTVVDIPAVSFDPSALNGCVPFEIELTNTSETPIFYEWNFGDGNTSIDENPNHVFEEVGTYDVTLVATDINGCFNDTTISNIIVHPRAEAIFEFERNALCGLPAVIHFENNSVGATGFTWNFGNGATTNNNAPTFSYAEAGDYSVELIATNQFACADTVLQNLTIHPEPEASFEIEGSEGCEPMEVTFNNSSTESNNFFWDFGNGNTSTETNPTALYENNGLYDVSLIVSIDDACFDTLILQEAINVHITPFANFEVEQTNQNVDDGAFQMVNLSENADNYYWEFSDGHTTEAIHPSHRFFNNGNKQIYLEASTEHGCVDDTLINFIPKTIKGLHLPNAFSPEQGLGDVRLFKPAGVGIKEYHIQIFSPYGQLMWESKELEDGQPAEAWDGTINGKLVAQDVYVWKAYALFDDGTIWQGVPKKNGGYKTMGSVTLLR